MIFRRFLSNGSTSMGIVIRVGLCCGSGCGVLPDFVNLDWSNEDAVCLFNGAFDRSLGINDGL